MQLKELIAADLFRYAGNNTRKSFWYHFKYSTGFRFTFFLRVCQAYPSKHPFGFLGRIYYNRLTLKYGYQIPKSAVIGKGFLIMHFGHLVINSGAIIGDNCNIYHGVTIGSTARGNNAGVPILGNKVWVGTGAVIVGKITVGDDVLIAPNSYVNISVPSNSVVLGNPARIIAREHSTDGYLLNLV